VVASEGVNDAAFGGATPDASCDCRLSVLRRGDLLCGLGSLAGLLAVRRRRR
jgi:hypothetical protein